MSSAIGSVDSLSSRASSTQSNGRSGPRRWRVHCAPLNPRTPAGRQRQLLQLLLLPMVPIVAVFVYTSAGIAAAAASARRAGDTTARARLAVDFTYVLRALQAERANVAALASANATDAAGFGLLYMYELASSTDHAVRNVSTWPTSLPPSQPIATRHSLLTSLAAHRLDTRERQTTIAQEERFYARIIDGVIAVVCSHAPASSNGQDERLARNAHALYWLARAEEASERANIYGQRRLADGCLAPREYLDLRANFLLEDAALLRAFAAVPSLRAVYERDYASHPGLLARRRAQQRLVSTPPSPTPAPSLLHWQRVAHDHRSVLASLVDTVTRAVHSAGSPGPSPTSPSLHTSLLSLALLSLLLLLHLPIIAFFTDNAVATTRTIRSMVTIFATRAADLKRERRRAETILGTMLPRAIARDLRVGRATHAQQYPAATIFFSDIADFGAISAASEPMHVVALLNAFYSFLDARLQYYDVYKVETIGSVYMVVSGVPLSNGRRHVVEVATMALEILTATENFVIPHLPDWRLQLRIGVHTGPCAAGVVGVKMPRYCLFGDSVNIASRMQSNGLPFKIHISAAMNTALQKEGGFQTRHRGLLDIKGKGSMETYWLVRRTQIAPPRVQMGISMSDDGMLVQ